jgi:hypothetical protein
MTKLLPVRPGTINDTDKAVLREAGILVFEHPDPAEVNVLGDDCDCDCGTLLGNLIAEISARIGSDRPVSLCVTAGGELRSWPGPPISPYGGVELADDNGKVKWRNTSQTTHWIFVSATTGFAVNITGQGQVGGTAAAPPSNCTWFSVPPGATFTLTLVSPNTNWPTVQVMP